MKSLPPWNELSAKALAFITRLSPRERTIFFATSLMIVVVISDRIVIQPIFNTYKSLQLEIENLQIDIKKSMKLLSQKERILAEQKEYEVFSSKNKTPEEQAVGLLQHIEELANLANVNLLYVKPASVKNEEAGKKSLVTLECEGRMEEIMRFLYEVENSNQLLKVEKYTLRPTADGSVVSKLAATVSRPTLP